MYDSGQEQKFGVKSYQKVKQEWLKVCQKVKMKIIGRLLGSESGCDQRYTRKGNWK